MKDFLKYIKDKTPKDFQNKSEFGSLLAIIKNNKIKSIQELNDYINKQIDTSRIWLAKNKTAAITRLRRNYAKKLEYLNSIKKIIEKIK